MSKEQKKNRYHLLDTLRGLTLLSMIAYHGTWDLVWLYGIKWDWYRGTGAYIWQQSICWTFILLSGFCWSLGKHHLKRGLLVFGGGALVTLATVIFVWDDRVVFGVLTMLGSCMLFMIPLHRWMEKWNPWFGLAGSAFLFFLTRNVNNGYLGFERMNLIKLPEELYHGLASTYLGFCDSGFFSTDYFSLIPWFFLFLVGYFLYQGLWRTGIMARRTGEEQITGKRLSEKILGFHIPPLSFIGRHSLLIYMLHQPVLYFIFQTIFMIVN